MKTNFFRKEERLCSRKQIELLLKNGSSFVLYPFRLVWHQNDLLHSPYPAQIVISVSRKKYRKATDRNRVKRLIREAYRKNKEQLLYHFLRKENKKLNLMVIYVGNKIFTAQEIEYKLNLCLNRLQKEYVKDC